MKVRIRFGKGPKPGRNKKRNRRAALALAALLTPAAFLAGMMAAWRLAADLGWTSSFIIPSGVLSHWQVWLGVAAALQVGARYLNRYGKSAEPSTREAGA